VCIDPVSHNIIPQTCHRTLEYGRERWRTCQQPLFRLIHIPEEQYLDFIFLSVVSGFFVLIFHLSKGAFGTKRQALLLRCSLSPSKGLQGATRCFIPASKGELKRSR
jgi:hypothetical protein